MGHGHMVSDCLCVFMDSNRLHAQSTSQAAGLNPRPLEHSSGLSGNPLLHLLFPLNLGRNLQQSQLDCHSVPFRKTAFKTPLITTTCRRRLQVGGFLNKIIVQFPTEWYYSSVSRECVHKPKSNPISLYNFHLVYDASPPLTSVMRLFPSSVIPKFLLLLLCQTLFLLYDATLPWTSGMAVTFLPLWGQNPSSFQQC